MKHSKHKIIVGISGGVDSAVSALLLKQQGHHVCGIFMQNWNADQDDPYCTAEQDLSDARAVCDQIGIELQTVNFAKQYWDQVFQHCLDEFARGRTPNPDIWCNREIKFNVFLKHAQQLGAEKLATGHYAQIQQGDLYTLHCGTDPLKDQSYFLYTLDQYQLSQSVFPLGGILKSEVRKIAEQHRLVNYNKKDSSGICFIGERNFKNFLKEFLLAQPGDMETPEGSKIGRHDGVIYYTLGQRKGLNIGGLQDRSEEAWYVLDKDLKRNVLIIGQGHNHPLLYSQQLHCSNAHWVSGQAPSLPLQLKAKTRHRQIHQACTLTDIDADNFQVEFAEPQRAVTPGQSIVFYQGGLCLGGATIDKTKR